MWKLNNVLLNNMQLNNYEVNKEIRGEIKNTEDENTTMPKSMGCRKRGTKREV